MACLRMKYNATAVYLGEGMPKQNSLVADMVSVQLKNGTYVYRPFKGFQVASAVNEGYQRVKLVNIEAFSAEPFIEPWIEFGGNAKVLGVYDGLNVHCVLFNGLPLVWCEIE